eukprot:CAMPEP_0184711038 /NCGR_PEP_ID=MMETSP0314-20130426/1753_1 /TAXON_ID=38298 /ORGANISM="Rhodella maculata, Strain CCMP 736" /LENGTH=74 /DNA_ID=CAMNT_0027173043 /DNA_START=173 /DNA_END=397 /DNA_ORIENTATION=-
MSASRRECESVAAWREECESAMSASWLNMCEWVAACGDVVWRAGANVERGNMKRVKTERVEKERMKMKIDRVGV